MARQERRANRWEPAILVSVCSIALLMRLMLVIMNQENLEILMGADDLGYHRLASNLLAGNGYSWSQQPPYETNVYRTPGMPLILCAVYSIFGPSLLHATLFGVIVSTGVVFMTYLLTSRILGKRIGLLAMVLLAFDPLSIVYSNLLMTEVYSSAVVVCGAYLVVDYLVTRKKALLPMIGLVIGLGVMIHPILLFLPIFIVFLPLFSFQKGIRSHFVAACIAALVGIAPAAGWVVRNAKVADYAGISCVTAVNLLKYKAAGVMADINGTPLLEEAKELIREIESNLPQDASRAERWRAWEREGTRIILAHPLIYIKLYIKGMFSEFFGPGRDELARVLLGRSILDEDGLVTNQSIRVARESNSSIHLVLIRYGALCVQALTYFFFFTGLASLLINRRFALALGLLFPIGYILSLSGGPEAFCRFRVTYMPFVCILASIGLDSCLGHFGPVKNRATVEKQSD